MNDVYCVTILSVNSLNKRDKYTTDCWDIQEACRVIMTFAPKRGYTVTNVSIDSVIRLV